MLLADCPEHAEFADTLRSRLNLAFPILIDRDSRLAEGFGLNFPLTEDLCGLYREFGIDLVRFNAHARWELPMPATYVVDHAGIIRYAAVNADYTCRPEPQAALVALTTC